MSKKKIVNSLKSTRWLLAFYDLLLLILCSALIFFLYLALPINVALYQFAIFFVICFVFRFIFRIYKQIWRYGGVQCYLRLITADIVAFIVIYLVELLFKNTITDFKQVSILNIFFIVGLFLILSLIIRMTYRYAYKCIHKDNVFSRFTKKFVKIFSGVDIDLETAKEHLKKIKIVIVGAGRVGISLFEEISNSPSSLYEVMFFIDISKGKVGRSVQDLKIYSEDEIDKSLFDKYGVQTIIFATPNLSKKEKAELIESFKDYGCVLKTYDSPLFDESNGSKKTIRDFDITEVLFRKEVDLFSSSSSSSALDYYKDKVVLVTGGGGSIGSEMARQIASIFPKKLILLDICENTTYDLEQELKFKYKDKLDLSVEIVSITNKLGLEQVFKSYDIDIIIHAAAHKHVPLMEHNPTEAILNNVFGTNNLVELAEKYNVDRFMMVSTDKAVNPTNVMGATKRLCEMIVLSHAKESKHCVYSCTRFGNVLGSAGSVIPLFKRQIAAGGPLTLTDKRIVRYFMTIPEASRLVLISGKMAKNGELFVLDMGKPVKILSLAETLIQLSGFKPYVDIDIVETGLRPGEKLYEELLMDSMTLTKTDNELIFIEEDNGYTLKDVNDKLDKLNHIINNYDSDEIINVMHEIVPTYKDRVE